MRRGYLSVSHLTQMINILNSGQKQEGLQATEKARLLPPDIYSPLASSSSFPSDPTILQTNIMSPPGEGFSGFQAPPSQSAEIDASTPFVAAGDGDLELLQASIKKLGIPPNAADSNGFTFLHAACGYCRVEVIQWLLGLNENSAIIDINARDGDGDTPLHHCDDAVSAKMLIEAGADHQLKNDEGQTPLEVKEEELEECDDSDSDSDSDDEDRLKLKELVEYLKSLGGEESV